MSNAHNKIVTIEVINWEKYNPRKGPGKYGWFKLQNDIFSDSKFYSLSNSNKLLWVFILARCSQQSMSKVTLNLTQTSAILCSNPLKLDSNLKLMHELSMISYSNQIDQQCNTRSRLDKNKNKNKIREDKRPLVSLAAHPDECDSVTGSFFDLEKIYKNYPRQVGKTRGLLKLKTAVRNQQTYDELTLAVTNYSKSVANKEPQYIKHFSTWVSEWRDWINPDVKTTSRNEQLLAMLEEHDRKKDEQRRLLKTNDQARNELQKPNAIGTSDSDLERDPAF